MTKWRTGWAARCRDWLRFGVEPRLLRKFDAGTERYGPDFDAPRDPLSEMRDEVYDLLAYNHAARAQRNVHRDLLRRTLLLLDLALTGGEVPITDAEQLAEDIRTTLEGG